MFFVKKCHFFLILVLNIKVACSLYLTMVNMEGIIPVVNRKLIAGHIFSLYSVGNRNLTYLIKRSNGDTTNVLNIDKKTGDLYYSSTAMQNVSAEVIVEDDSQNTFSSHLEIVTVPIDSCYKEELRNVCFWSKVTYQVEKTSRRAYLGTLAPRTDLGGCNIKNITYALLTGTDYLKLHPPDNKSEYWLLGTNERFETFTKNISTLYSNVSCVLEILGTTLTYTNQVEVKLLDSDFYPPEPQERYIKILMNGSKIKKGHLIEHNILFLDQHPIQNSRYLASIDDKNVSDFLSPNCTVHVDSRNGKNRTAIHCKLLVTRSRTFKKDVSFLLGLRSTRVNYQENHNTGYMNITLSFENNHNKRSSSYFKNDNKIFRTAAPYARVTQPISHTKNMLNYNIKAIHLTKNPFQITTEGIVYVYDFLALRESREHLRLNITWSQNNRTQYEEISVRVIDEPNKTCVSMLTSDDWTFCSQFRNQKNCIKKDSCALGTGGSTSVATRSRPQRCMWRGDIKPDNYETHMYSTCSPDLNYCPDGYCDSLEMLREEDLCPQDCSTEIAFPTKLAETGRGVDKCNGVLVCDMGCFCEIRNNTEPAFKNVHGDKLVVDDKKCDLKCIMGITAGIVIIIIGVISFIGILWRKNHVKSVTNEKYMQEVETPFSDYFERNNIINEPLVLNFNMTTTFDSANLNCNTLKINEIDPKWEFPRNQICIEQILGEGEFGKVLKAKAFNIAGRPGYSLVAVKTLKDDARKQDYKDLFSECQLLKEVSHPHVIQLLGVCSSDEGPLYVIIEYAKFGSLRTYLRRNRHILTNLELASMEDHLTEKISPRDILSFARQISSGMSYLSDIKLVHRDLAARNILLAKDKICKVSDFGLTRDIYEENAYFKKSKGRVPVKWMAPESLADHLYTTKSDVWSFGILIWELVTLGASPYPGIPVHNLYSLLKDGYRMERPANCSTVLYSLMTRCWNTDPEERPSFMDLYHCFDSLLTDNMNYLDLSDNAIINKSYFSMEAETGDSRPSFENMNLLENYPLQKESLENKDKTYNVQENRTFLGYETPVKTPRRTTTPTNEMPEEYTDMNFKE